MLGALLTLAYGLLSIVGGIIGYRQAGSKVSLTAGIISGFLLLVGAGLMFQGNAAGSLLAQIVTALLVIVFISPLIKTGKFMPAGLMVGVGVLTLIALFLPIPV